MDTERDVLGKIASRRKGLKCDDQGRNGTFIAHRLLHVKLQLGVYNELFCTFCSAEFQEFFYFAVNCYIKTFFWSALYCNRVLSSSNGFRLNGGLFGIEVVFVSLFMLPCPQIITLMISNEIILLNKHKLNKNIKRNIESVQ